MHRRTQLSSWKAHTEDTDSVCHVHMEGSKRLMFLQINVSLKRTQPGSPIALCMQSVPRLFSLLTVQPHTDVSLGSAVFG